MADQASVHPAPGEPVEDTYARADHRSRETVTALHDAALVHLHRGDLAEAASALVEAATLGRRAMLSDEVARVADTLALVRNLQGWAGEALQLSDDALALARQQGLPRTVASALLNRARAHAALGALDRADEACASALSLVADYSHPLRAAALTVAADLRRSRCLPEATRTAEQALAAARRHTCGWTLARCLLQVAELRLASGSRERATTAAAEAGLVLRQYGDQLHLVRWHLLAARLSLLAGYTTSLVHHTVRVLTRLGEQSLAARATTELAGLLAATVADDRHGQALTPAAVAAGDAFAPVATDLLGHGDVAVRTWVVQVLAESPAVWSWTVLNQHTDASPVLRRGVSAALEAADRARLPDLEVRCLGECTVRQGGALIPEGRWNSLHAKLILAYLTLHGPATRDELMELLWPDEDPDKGATRLHSTMRLLRRSLCPDWRTRADYVVRLGERYQLAPDVTVTSDVGAFLHEFSRALHGDPLTRRLACRQAVQHYGGDFLPGWCQDWVLHERRRLTTDWFFVHEQHAAAVLDEGDLPKAERLAREMVTAAPLRESGWQFLMEALAGQDRVPEALTAYQELAELLHDELAVAPSTTSTAVMQVLRRGVPAATARARMASLRHRDSEG